VSKRADFALTWLGLQEAEDEKIKRWTLDAAVIAAALSAIAVLAALGVIK
jgi:hypothetical protein